MAIVREFVMFVKESAYKVPKTTPVVWTQASTYGLANSDAYYGRLPGSNQFTMRMRPIGLVTVPYGGGIDIPAYTVSDKQECVGRYTTIASVSTLPFFLSWAGVRINAGQTSPWVTTEIPGDLASASIYHGIQLSDGTILRKVYLGAKVTAWTFSLSEGSTVANLSLDLRASLVQGNQFDASSDPNATIFPSPADNNFTIDPYLFIYAGGASYITLGGNVRTEITELTITSNNTFTPHWYPNSRFVPNLRFFGRRTTAATRFLYKPTPVDRTVYEALSTHSVSIQLNNGTHGVTFNLGAQNVFSALDDDLQLTDWYFQPATELNQWDPSLGADNTITFT